MSQKGKKGLVNEMLGKLMESSVGEGAIKHVVKMVFPKIPQEDADFITETISKKGFTSDAFFAISKPMTASLHLAIDKFAQNLVSDIKDAQESVKYARTLKFMVTPNYESLDLDILLFESLEDKQNRKLSKTTLRSIVGGLALALQKSENLADFKLACKTGIKAFFYGAATVNELPTAHQAPTT